MGRIIGVWLCLELVVAWLLSHWIGLGGLLLSWLIAIVLGSYLLRGLGEHLRSLRQGAAGVALTGPLARVGAALLLIIPGTLTDLLALLLLIPATQTRLSGRWAASAGSWRSTQQGFGAGRSGFDERGRSAQGDVIEGEWVDETKQNPRIGPAHKII